MSIVTIGLTTKALIHALRWRRIEAEDNAQTKSTKARPKVKRTTK